MFARYLARRRVRKAHAAYIAARAKYHDALTRQDTRPMSVASANLRATNSERLAAENALSKLEGFGGLGRWAA